MKLENAIIIALIVIILVLVGAYLFAGHGNSDAQSQGSVINTHPNTVNTDVQTSGQSSGSKTPHLMRAVPVKPLKRDRLKEPMTLQTLTKISF